MPSWLFWLLWGTAFGGGWFGAQIAPPGLEFKYEVVGFISAPLLIAILVTIYEMKRGRPL
jgi:hypothetical protein